MNGQDKQTPESVALYLSSDQKHETTRAEISELRSELAEYAKRLAAMQTDQTNLRARLEEGVSKTAFKAWEAAQQLNATMAKFDFRIEKSEIIVGEHTTRLDRGDRFNDRIVFGMVAVVFLAVFSGVMTFLWRYKP